MSERKRQKTEKGRAQSVGGQRKRDKEYNKEAGKGGMKWVTANIFPLFFFFFGLSS